MRSYTTVRAANRRIKKAEEKLSRLRNPQARKKWNHVLKVAIKVRDQGIPSNEIEQAIHAEKVKSHMKAFGNFTIESQQSEMQKWKRKARKLRMDLGPIRKLLQENHVWLIRTDPQYAEAAKAEEERRKKKIIEIAIRDEKMMRRKEIADLLSACELDELKNRCAFENAGEKVTPVYNWNEDSLHEMLDEIDRLDVELNTDKNEEYHVSSRRSDMRRFRSFNHPD